jgi:hypothetical protein
MSSDPPLSYQTDNACPSPASSRSREYASRVSSLTPKSQSALFLTTTSIHRITNPPQPHQWFTPSHPPLRPTSTAKAHSFIAFGTSTAISRDLLRFPIPPLRDRLFPSPPWGERLHRLLHLASHLSGQSLLTVNELTPHLRSSKSRHRHHPLLRDSNNNNNRIKRCSFSLSSLASTSPDTSRGATCRICGIVGHAPTPCPWLHFGSRLYWRRLVLSIARRIILECFGL